MKNVIGLLLLISLAACGAKPPAASTPAVLPPPPKPVGVMHLQFLDAERGRPQNVTLWYPALGTEADRRRDYAHFFRRLCRRGGDVRHRGGAKAAVAAVARR